MSLQKTPNNASGRKGEQYRANAHRYFHVMSQGWYVHTRDGVRGPFNDKSLAVGFITQLIDQNKAAADLSWRL